MADAGGERPGNGRRRGQAATLPADGVAGVAVATGSLDAWIDALIEAAMRDGVTRRRMQRVFMGTLASIREDGGELWEAWRKILADSLRERG